MAASVNPPRKVPKYKYVCGPNEIHPALVGIANNLILFPWSASAGRLYMAGNMIPKSVVTSGADERMMVTGFEWKQGYAQTARRIEAPSNMIVEEVFYVDSLKQNSEEKTDAWNKIYVVFKNEEHNAYDVLELPRYNTQNTHVGFEYVYNKEVMRRLTPGATFPKGTIFAQSPRISKSGEWCFGMNTKVAAISSFGTEEDAIWLTESYARDRLKCMFRHERGFQWNEDEFIPLMLYGTDENPRPFAQSGERIRQDGLVMGFRRRITDNALVSLTKKALRTPDLTYDILFYAPIDCEVMAVEIISDRMKNRSNNRSTDHIRQPHTDLLERYEKKQNEMWNNVLRWYDRRTAANQGKEPPITFKLDTFINSAGGNFTRNVNTGKINPLNRAIKRVKLKDWNVTIQLREIVSGKVKFKFAGLNGDKGVSVKIIPDDHAPMYDDGTRAEVIINNTPAFRRQIYSMLMELSINYINVQIQKEVKVLRNQGDYEGAYAKLLEFYHTGFPEFGEIVEKNTVGIEAIRDHVDHCADRQITIHVRSDTRLFGVNIINALRAKYDYRPQQATFVNSLGERVRTVNPILISNQHFMMLDKFGTDMSAQALPKSNLFGMPAKVNESNKYANWLKDQGNRNTGETEGRLRTSQNGAQEMAKKLAMAYSPELRKRIPQRIIRAEDPWNINQIVKPEEYSTNRAVKMGGGMLSDAGWIVRNELPTDRTFEPANTLIPYDRLDSALKEIHDASRTYNPAEAGSKHDAEMLRIAADKYEGL